MGKGNCNNFLLLITAAGRDRQWMPTSGGEEPGYSHSLKESHPNLFIHYQVLKVPSWWRKLRHHLNQVINFNMANNGKWPSKSPWETHWDGPNMICVIFLPKMLDLNLIMVKQSDKSRLKRHSRKQLAYIFLKKVIVIKEKTRWRKHFRRKKIKKPWQLNVMWDS